MTNYDKRLNATYGGDNNYFLLENGNILEVVNDDLRWDHFKTWDDSHGIADDFNDLYESMSEAAYDEISKRAIDNFIKENDGKLELRNSEIPGDPNNWGLYDKATDECVFKDDLFTNEDDAYRDAMAAYFANVVAQTSESRAALGYSYSNCDLKELLEYCKEKEIDISDMLEYREVHSRIDRNSSAIAFADTSYAAIAGVEPSKIIDGAAIELQAYLDQEVYRANEYTIDGEEVDSCSGFIGDDIEMNGIEDNFGKAIEKLGSYENLEACLEDNQEKLGIEIEPVKPLQDRLSRRGDER